MVEPIVLKPLSAWEQAQKKRAKLSKPLKVLTSLKTTAVLGATLGARLSPATALRSAKAVGKFVAPKSIKGAVGLAVGVPIATGVLTSSKKAREAVKEYVNPIENIKKGQKLGEIIQDPSKAKDVLGIKEGSSFKEKVIVGAKTAGKAGAVLAGGLALAGGVKKIKGVLEKRKAEKLAESQQLQPQYKQLGFTEPQNVGLGGIPVGNTAQVTPSQAPQSQISPQPISNIIQISIR